MKRYEIGLFFVIVAAIIGALIVIAVDEKNSSIAQVLLTLALVLITFIYAWQTRMTVNEMKKQRHEAFRPIIDIVVPHKNNVYIATQYYNEHNNPVPIQIPCILRNIGVGPAIDLHSFILSSNKTRQRFDFGTIAKGGETSKDLALFNDATDTMLIVFYYDIYRNGLVSKRIVNIRDNNRCIIGNLSIEPFIIVEESQFND